MIKPHNRNSEFELGGINHVALVCSDMARTVEFYSNVLGMPLIKSLDLPGDAGQHFFFDAGNGDCVAFFWFADAPDGVPGLSSPAAIPGIGDITSAVSTMNHLAFHVPAEKFDAYRQRLKDKGVRVGPVLNHDESERQVAAAVHPGRLRAIVLLPGPGRDYAGVRLLDQRNSRPTTRRPYPRRRPIAASRPRTRPSVAVQARIGQLVEQRRELVDQLLGIEPNIAGQPRADRLPHPADDEVRRGLDPVVLRHS